MNKSRRTYQDGLWAEAVAEVILRLKGYRILARRYKTPMGEIDIIARRGKMLAFVEVKFRRTIPEALACLTPSMKSRIVNAARHFIAAYPAYGDYDMRFDLFALTGPFSFRHLDNAWPSAT